MDQQRSGVHPDECGAERLQRAVKGARAHSGEAPQGDELPGGNGGGWGVNSGDGAV